MQKGYEIIRFLLILQVTQMKIKQCLSQNITRDSHDRFPSSIADFRSRSTFVCEQNDCRCITPYTTFIMDNKTSLGKCVRDQDVIDQPTGLTVAENGLCLEGRRTIQNNTASYTSSCAAPSLRIRWLWEKSGHLVNIRTLECLAWEKSGYMLRQCSSIINRHRWVCSERKGIHEIASRERRQELSAGNCSAGSYYGCYRYWEFSFMRFVKPCSKCEKVGYAIRAPILLEHRYCKIDWSNSSYLADGSNWHSIKGEPKEFYLRTSSLSTAKTLWIKKSELWKWSGSILRLTVQCSSSKRFNKASSSERHCILLKILGWKEINPSTQPKITTPSTTLRSTSSTTLPLTSTTEALPSTTSTEASVKPSETLRAEPTTDSLDPITTAPRSTTLPLAPENNNEKSNNQEQNTNKDEPVIIPVVAPTVALFGLFIAFIGIALLYKKRKRSMSRKQNIHLYEESNPPDTWRNGSVPPSGDIRKLPNTYDTPGCVVNSVQSNDDIYEEPNKPNSEKLNTGNNLNYNYATRDRNAPKPIKGHRNRQKIPLPIPPLPDDIYQEIETDSLPRTSVTKGGGRNNAGLSTDGPFYHTLEKNRDENKGNNGANKTEVNGDHDEHFYLTVIP